MNQINDRFFHQEIKVQHLIALSFISICLTTYYYRTEIILEIVEIMSRQIDRCTLGY
jgi:hypothetical protein